MSNVKESIKQLELKQRLMCALLYQQLEKTLAQDEATERFITEENKTKSKSI